MNKILVIDDDAKTTRALKIRLQLAGYEVLTAADGVYGLELAMESKPDLAIIDIMMPFGGGFSVAYRLRERAQDVPVIFITASKQAGLRKKASELGAVDFLEKPYQSEELLAAVTLALKGRSPSPVTSEQPPPSLSPQPTGATTGSNSPVTPKPPAKITGRNKILIVEDDRKIALAVALRLRAAGQDVLLAYDAMTGLDSVIKNQPDMVVLDICLPGGSGFGVAERIQNLTPRFTPIIFITASRQPGLREEATDLGAAGFLEEPFEADELIAMIQNALNPPDDDQLFSPEV